MALSPLLHLRQSQSLVMTPQLMQSIKLLQMTALELERFLDIELEKNPLLEREDYTEDAPVQDIHSQESPTKMLEPLEGEDLEDSLTAPLIFKGDNDENMPIPAIVDIADTYDASLENIYPDDQQIARSDNNQKLNDWHDSVIKPFSIDVHDIENIIAEKPSLRHFIAEQIMFLPLSEQEKFIAFDLADQLDDTGYFSGNLAETAQRLNFSEMAIADIFKKLQQFDPPGIFATSLRECLSIQLQRQNRLDPAIQIILDNLPELAKRNFNYLVKITRLDICELVEILEEIQMLNPKPGLEFTSNDNDFIIPDVIIHKDNNGEYQAELNMAVLPKLIMHHDYSAKICVNADERSFIGECIQNAHWLLRALDQRAKTLLKVSREIMRHQQDFLNLGIGHLKPLNLAMIADAVGMHESTISRVTANKYVATPRGTFEMRSFFSASLQSTTGGKNHAADAVRHRIAQLIDDENVNAILSDDKLVEILKKENIDIARRTVAKYRESMNISSSVARRREKKARYDATKS